ncbi:sugar phosphate isomerase/epimerase [Aurantibacter crassamenti]|uniref:sugar phosphate isomerase/epimerase family protein n=1 Tax=Aurantibacter crassamenti TaxID=1837375 RepID=UPI00193A9F0A|nr:sugar phosphate isomerase/epimerase family protein [Aurantibacter crassamenti]MBM1108231.1 sugar phosphate isomerase/epimerase [Aurantibacter crassamenti]
MDKKRRNVLRSLALAPILLSSRNLFASPLNTTSASSRLQYSVNAYTFNSLLKSGEMTFFDMMEFASTLGLNAVDITGYYFTNFPKIPDDKTLFQLKKKALELGLNISWTGVRNNFVNPDKTVRESDAELIKNWLQVSSKLGASIMRIFPGKGEHEGYSRDEVKKWMVSDFQKCATYAEETGVIAGMQHHNDFLFEADEVIDILKRVNSEWFGLILDIGSLRKGNPYEEIQKLAPYANYWFIKELVYVNGIAEPVNMQKIARILKDANYTGYISFESLTDGDPKQIVTSMFADFRAAYEKL